MLDHLHIENYRLFKSLQLDGLQRVNLITGKNNTGKTAILEAIRILKSSKDSLKDILSHILTKRDAFDNNLTNTEVFQSLINKKENLTFKINDFTITKNDRISFTTHKLFVIETISNNFSIDTSFEIIDLVCIENQ